MLMFMLMAAVMKALAFSTGAFFAAAAAAMFF